MLINTFAPQKQTPWKRLFLFEFLLFFFLLTPDFFGAFHGFKLLRRESADGFHILQRTGVIQMEAPAVIPDDVRPL